MVELKPRNREYRAAVKAAELYQQGHHWHTCIALLAGAGYNLGEHAEFAPAWMTALALDYKKFTWKYHGKRPWWWESRQREARKSRLATLQAFAEYADTAYINLPQRLAESGLTNDLKAQIAAEAQYWLGAFPSKKGSCTAMWIASCGYGSDRTSPLWPQLWDFITSEYQEFSTNAGRLPAWWNRLEPYREERLQQLKLFQQHFERKAHE